MQGTCFLLAVCVSLLGTPIFAAAPLFPEPLHLVRQVQDPISGTTTVLNEYGYGNRLVSVRGDLVSIADYDRSELTEIDRSAGTYSITRFDALAKAAQSLAPPLAATTEKSLRHAPRALGARAASTGRSADFFQDDLESKPMRRSIEVGIDRTVSVSRDALEVLVGSAYPGTRLPEHDVVIAAAANRAVEPSYALPVEQTIRYEVEGQKLEFRTSVTRVGNELPPPDLLSIPPGARLVVSRMVAVQRELDQLDHPAVPPPRKP